MHTKHVSLGSSPQKLISPSLSQKTRNIQFWDDFAFENLYGFSRRKFIDSGRRGKKEERARRKGRGGLNVGGQVISNVTRYEVTC
jgi:hypothetical protein